MDKKELAKFLYDNFYNNEFGYIDLKGLDFTKFGCDVELSGMKVDGDLYQSCQEVSNDLYQDCQKVGYDLFQDGQTVGNDLYQGCQIVKGKTYDKIE